MRIVESDLMADSKDPENMTEEERAADTEALMAKLRAELAYRRGRLSQLAEVDRGIRGLGLPIDTAKFGPGAPAGELVGNLADRKAQVEATAPELTPTQARERLGMPEEVFARAWPAFYDATAGPGLRPRADPGPITHLATADGRPYLAVFREPWEVLELTEAGPYGAALTAAATTTAATFALLVEWNQAGQPESMGAELAQAFGEAANARAAFLEELRRIYRPSLPPLKAPARGALAGIANAFPQGIGTIPSSKPIQAALAAISNAQEGSKAWQKDPAGLPFYAYGEVGITYSTSPPDEADLQLSERVWDQLRRLDDTAGDVLLAAMAQWMLERDADGDTHITAAKILDYRGIKPRRVRESAISARGGHRPEDLAKIAAAFEHLDHLWLDLSSVEVLEDAGAGKKPRRRRSLTLQSKLISVSDRISQTEIDLTGARPRGATPIAWTYRPGKSLTPFLEKPNLQTALLLQKALEYDPYRHVWEKRLARYFTIHLRIGTSYGPAVRRKVGPLLEELSLAIDTRHPERTKQRFEVAMARLAEDGVIGPWRPIVEPLPARKWLPAWLNSVVTVTAPAALSDHYAALANKAATKRNRAQRLPGKS